MGIIEKIIRWISDKGSIVGSIALIGLMILIVANVLSRLIGPAIPGAYDYVELIIIVVVGFALAYAGMMKFHTSVRILVERLPERTQAFFLCFTSFLGCGFWVLVTWMNIQVSIENARVGEYTIIGTPVLPFRWIWDFGLGLLTVILLNDFINALRRAMKK